MLEMAPCALSPILQNVLSVVLSHTVKFAGCFAITFTELAHLIRLLFYLLYLLFISLVFWP